METKELVEIVRRAQKGDSKAQQELYLDSGKSVYYLALKILKNETDAEDIAQDVFITVFEKITELKQPAAYYKWLNQITANKCMSFMRKKKPIPGDEQDILEVLELEDDDSVTPEKLYDDEETRRLIMQIIDELPDAQRICVMYRYFNQLSFEEIAAITGTNENTVKSRLMLARNKIRAAILAKEEKEGIRLHVLIPIMPILMKSLEEFQMPQGLSEQMWQKIAEGAGIAAGTGAAATAASEAAQAGAKEAVKQGIKAKVIGGAVAAVAVVGVATAILWPKPELPAQVTSPPSSAPVVSQQTSPPPSQTSTRTEIQDPTIETAIRSTFGLSQDELIDSSIFNQIQGFSISPTHNENQYDVWIYVVGSQPGKVTVDDVKSLDIGDFILLKSLQNVRLEKPPLITDYSILGSLDEYAFKTLEIINDINCKELPSFKRYYTMGEIRLVNLPNLLNFPELGEKTISPLIIKDCPIIDLSMLTCLTEQRDLQIKNTPVSANDLLIISGLKNLTALHLVNCGITDPSPLLKLGKLSTLILSGNPIENESILDQFNVVNFTYEKNN